jgi:transglutaminase-like putative cysteine protease
MRFILACSLSLLVAAAASAQFQNNDPKPAAEAGAIGPQLDQKVVHRYQVGVRIRAIGGPVAGLTGTFAIPAEWDDQQVKQVEENISPHVRQHTVRSGDCNLRQIVFSVPQLAAGETATCVYTYEVTSQSSSKAPTDIADLVIPKNPPREVKKFLLPSPQIEITNPKIRTLAKDATEGKATAWEQVAAIYEAVREKVKIENDKLKGAANTLRDGMGAEEDVAAVFVACCRAHKVPARTLFVPDSCHAEFYLEDAAGKGKWFPVVIDGDKAFGFRPKPTVILQRGDNIRVPELKDPQRFVIEHLTGKGNTGGRPEVEFVRRFAD